VSLQATTLRRSARVRPLISATACPVARVRMRTSPSSFNVAAATPRLHTGAWVARTLLVGLAAALTAAAVAAADDTPTSGSFQTPGYTPQQRGGTSGLPGGVPGTASGMADPRIDNRRLDRLPSPGAGDGIGDRARPGLVTPRRAPEPTEFQLFVQGATGRLLPIFGADFFADPQALRTGDNVPVAGDYVVGPGDELMVRVWGSIDGDLRSTVDRNGLVHLPRIGSFTVAGIKAADLESHLRAQIGRLYTNFNLNVTLGQLRGVRVFVVGAATQVGVLNLPSPATLVSAVVAAGGPNPSGSMRRVLLRRGTTTVAELDLYDLMVSGDRSKDPQLQAGDVVVIEPAGPRVALTGTTDRAAIYELKPGGEPLSALLRYAGGAPVLADRSRVQLQRLDPAQPKAPRKVEILALDGAGPQTSLRDGDVLTLLPMPERFANAVTLRGAVAAPIRYPYATGMRIRDLIPDRDALIPAEFLRRKNELVQVQPGRRGEVPSLSDPRFGDVTGTARSPNATGTGSALGYGNGTDGTAGARPEAVPSSRTSRASGPETPRDNLLGGATLPSTPLDAAEAAARSRVPTPLFNDINWDYAVIERLDDQALTTQVIPFNLGRAVLHGDPEHNLPLRPGDVVTIYSQRDLRGPLARQTRLVTVDGEVASPGVYQLKPGETLRQLLGRAGGFTPQAYLYGLEFTRESTRQRQRENLASAISRLEALAATQSARDAANRRDDDRIGAVSNAATQAQLARLRQLQPNGRIALELEPAVNRLEQLPDVPLEHGDRISVPPRAGFVTVAGAVVNANAFLWRPDRTTGDYLRLAGVEEAADPSNIFILRADGTVTTAADNRSWFRGRIEGLPLNPGDAVIVPNQLDFETFGRALVRNLKDWSQILANFGIGAAAIKALRE
jgi:polysaccharide export outer membrane protein